MRRARGWAEIAGKILFADVTGSGDVTFLLIHEIGGSVQSWDELMPYLPSHVRVVRYDIHGNGRSERITGPLVFGSAVHDAAALLDCLGVTGPVVPIGCAVGGAIALGFAAAYPERSAAVVALAPSTYLPPSRRAAALARADEVEAEGLRGSVDAALARSYPPVLRGDAWRFEQARAMRIAANPTGFAAMMRMLAQLDMESDLASIRCPALVIAGEYDGDRPPDVVIKVAQSIRDAEFTVIPSGHFMAWQTPDLVARALLSFLARRTQCLESQEE